jgi:hypothetical protein
MIVSDTTNEAADERKVFKWKYKDNIQRTYTEQRHFSPIDNWTKWKVSNAGHEERQLSNAVEVLEKSDFLIS